ncbi:hypothetical protein AAGT00_00630 (plasmid) [Streptomyces cavourensis]
MFHQDAVVVCGIASPHHWLTSSSRPLAAGRGLRLRINLMPTTAYTGPRNAFDVLDDVREAAATSACEARARELEAAAETGRPVRDHEAEIEQIQDAARIPEQLSLDPQRDDQLRAESAIDALNRRFGGGTVGPAAAYGRAV